MTIATTIHNRNAYIINTDTMNIRVPAHSTATYVFKPSNGFCNAGVCATPHAQNQAIESSLLTVHIHSILHCTHVLQSQEREKLLRVQLEESQEMMATATTTTEGLKKMLHNKDEILNLNQTCVTE